MDKYIVQLADALLDLAVVAIITFVGYLLVRFVLVKLFQRLLRRYGIDEVFIRFASLIFTIISMFLVIIVALGVIGVQALFLTAILAATLVALLAAMQGWLRNVAAGLWMFLNAPFKLDDQVEIAGKKGRVQEISLLTTSLRTRDNLKIIMPNRQIVSNIITNFDANPERRIELVIEIAYEEDIQQAIDVIRSVLQADERILAEPEAIIAVADLATNGVKLDVRPWVKQADFSSTRYALRHNIKLALDAQQITIPYQQVQLHTTE